MEKWKKRVNKKYILEWKRHLGVEKHFEGKLLLSVREI